MKKVLFLILLFIPQVSESACFSEGIFFWPHSLQISVNPVFLIEGYDESRTVIEKLNTEHKAFLYSDIDTIPLEVIQILKGQFKLTQALVKPVRNLQEGKIYKIKIENYTPDLFQMRDYNRGWYVKDYFDNSKPLWKRSPVLFSKKSVEYGCGPARHVKFCICIKDESSVAILTKTKNLSTGEAAEYFLMPDSSILGIGYGMCAGAFKFTDGQRYESIFTLMDASGNFGRTTGPVRYKSPVYEENKNYYTGNCDCKELTDNDDETFIQNIVWDVLLLLLKVSLISSSYIS